MLTSKQRALLRGLASTKDPVFQIGKGEIDEPLIRSVADCLEARELIKLSCLQTAMVSAAGAAAVLAEATGAEVVTVIGNRFVLYRQRKEKPRYAALLRGETPNRRTPAPKRAAAPRKSAGARRGKEEGRAPYRSEGRPALRGESRPGYRGKGSAHPASGKRTGAPSRRSSGGRSFGRG